jgi:hypothetical protein
MFYEDSRMGMAKSATPNPYNNHGVGCPCILCGQTRGMAMAKRDAGASEEKMHLAIAHSLHHSQAKGDHERKAYGWGGVHDGQSSRRPSIWKRPPLTGKLRTITVLRPTPTATTCLRVPLSIRSWQRKRRRGPRS